MQSYRSEYSSRHQKYHNSSMGPNPYEMASGYGNCHGKNMNAMMASSQHSQYGYHQAHAQSYGSDQYGMSKQKASRYGSEIQPDNGAMGPYASHMSSSQFSHAQNHYARNPGGHYHSQQQQHHHTANSMEYGGAKNKMHTAKGGNMFHKSKGANMNGYRGKNRNNYSDNEYCSGSDYDDNDSGSDSEYNTDCDSESDFDDRRRGRKTTY